MHVFGLHVLDLAIVLTALLGLLALGVAVSRGVKDQADFFVGGRTIGGWLQFFLNFGLMSDSNGAPAVASEVARQGAGGIWISMQVLFCTPFYWFSSIWFRRTRAVTVADLFADRFASRGLAMAYAFLQIGVAVLTLGLGNVISYKVSAAMMVKPDSEWSAAERRSVDDFHEFQALAAEAARAPLSGERQERLRQLAALSQRGELHAFVSYLRPLWFSIGYAAIVAVYIGLGGLRAAAVTDALQGVLIVVFSLIMIPVGLAKVGGFAGLHRLVPEGKFALFGGASANEYTWYSIGAMFVVALCVTPGAAGSVGPTAAAGRNERVLRIGSLGGAFAKRFMLIAWMLCGLLVAALLPQGLSDPDNAWGVLAVTLLAPGLLGLMIAGMVLGHMPQVGHHSVNASALFTRNIYAPLVPGRAPAHYLRVAKAAIPVVLAASVLVSLVFAKVIPLLSTIITFSTLFGGVCFLVFFWRRLRPPAIYAAMALQLLVIGALPWVLPRWEAVRRAPSLLVEARDQTAAAAGAHDPTGAAPMALARGAAPVAVYFDGIIRSDPADPNSPREGIGRFGLETWLLSRVGVPVERFGPAGLTTCRWLFDGFFPYTVLILVSLCCGRRPTPAELAQRARDDRFFAKTKTPVGEPLEEDGRAVAASQADPGRFDALKLFPGSSWEFTRWTRNDVLGFGLGWVMVGVVLLVLWGLLTVGG